MAVEVFDLSGSLVSQELESTNGTISGTKVPENIGYTYITVTRNRLNGVLGSTSSTQAITTDAPTVEEQATGKANRFSAVSRLTTSIALPLPRNIPFSWNNDWSQEDITVFGMAGAAAGNEVSSVADAATYGSEAAKAIGLDVLNTFAMKKRTQKGAGVFNPPFREVFYSGVAFRTFSFSWEFAPQNEKESEQLDRLLYYLELSSHPEAIGETSVSTFYLPESFNLEFKGTTIPPLKTLALTGMNVEYAQFGPKFMKDKTPAFVSLDLTFLEMYPLTKDDIRKSRGNKYADLFPKDTGSAA